jgi:hypothetical protein
MSAKLYLGGNITVADAAPVDVGVTDGTSQRIGG